MEEDGTIKDTTSIVTHGLQSIPMPELESGEEWLVALFHSTGCATATGMGLVGLSWSELICWREATDNIGIVGSKELTILFQMSRAYAGEYANARDKNATPPYAGEIKDIEERREIISNKMEELFSMMIAAQNREIDNG